MTHATRLWLVAALIALPSPRNAAAAQAASAPSTTAVITGQVIDAETKAAIGLADVELRRAGLVTLKTTTDKDGRFSLQGIPAGAYSLAVSGVGYQRLVRDSLAIAPAATMTLMFDLPRIVARLETVTVTPGAFSFMDKESAMRLTLSRDDIDSVPQIGEDLFRAINRLPGLSSGDYSAHFSIRGGRHDETLIQLDGLELYEPYHLKDFNEGAVSIIDTETVESVELLTGGFSARYGNKRSGVMNITSRAASADRAQYSASASFTSARAMGSGPLWGGKGSWLLSARNGFMGLVFSLINQNQLPAPRYQDVFGKLQRTIGTHHVLTFDALHADDRYTFDAPSSTGFEDSLRTRERAKNRYRNSYVWSTLVSSLGTRTTVHTLIATALVTRARDGAEVYVDFNDKPLYSLSNTRHYGIAEGKQDWRFRVSNTFIVNAGFDLRGVRNTDTFQKIVNEDPDDPLVDKSGYPITSNTGFKKRGTLLGVYVTNRWRVATPLTLEVGGRYDRASYTNDNTFSPRAAAAIELGRGRTARVGWGLYRQIQGIDDVAALNDAGKFFPSEVSRQWTVGIEQTLAKGTLFRLEGYGKRGSHLRPTYRNWKNAPDVFPEANEDRILVYPQSSTSSGIELYFARPLGRRLNLNTSYAYAKVEEQVSGITNVNARYTVAFDSTHPAPQDQRHAVHLDLSYRAGSWAITSSLAYHSGWPGTLEELVAARDADGDPISALRPVKIYGARLPPYFREDVRVTRRSRHWAAFVEIVNVTNHDNVFGYNYFRVRESGNRIGVVREDEKWFTILPSLGISWHTRF